MAPAQWAAALVTLIRGIMKRKIRRQKGKGGGPQRSKQKAWDAGKKEKRNFCFIGSEKRIRRGDKRRKAVRRSRRPV